MLGAKDGAKDGADEGVELKTPWYAVYAANTSVCDIPPL
jgi:hypothetical protein